MLDLTSTTIVHQVWLCFVQCYAHYLWSDSTGISNPCKELERLGINVTGKGVTACTYQDVCANLNLLSQEA